MNDLKPSCIVLDSDYTGEHNARMGVAEWLGGAIQKISIEEARKYLLQKEKDQASLNADILIGGTGEDTTELVLDLAKSMKQPLTIFLASILPDCDIPPFHVGISIGPALLMMSSQEHMSSLYSESPTDFAPKKSPRSLLQLQLKVKKLRS